MWYENILFKEPFIRKDGVSHFGGTATSINDWFETNLSYLFPNDMDITHVEVKIVQLKNLGVASHNFLHTDKSIQKSETSYNDKPYLKDYFIFAVIKLSDLDITQVEGVDVNELRTKGLKLLELTKKESKERNLCDYELYFSFKDVINFNISCKQENNKDMFADIDIVKTSDENYLFTLKGDVNLELETSRKPELIYGLPLKEL